MAERRKQQDYCNLLHYLTDDVWDALQSKSREQATNCLLSHCWRLGLRCPSEGTFSLLFNLVCLTEQEKIEVSSFERYSLLNKMKKAWKQFKTANKQSDFDYTEYLETLPAKPADLPAEYYLQAFSEQQATKCRDLSEHLFLHVLPWCFSLCSSRFLCFSCAVQDSIQMIF